MTYVSPKTIFLGSVQAINVLSVYYLFHLDIICGFARVNFGFSQIKWGHGFFRIKSSLL